MARELKSLNGLRFPACLIIFMAHLPDWAQPDNAVFRAIAQPFVAQAQAAMPLFFVLSGLVLMHVYASVVLPPGLNRPSREGSAVFIVSRIARLFPLHLLALLLIFPLAWQRGEVAILPLLANLTLTQTFVPDFKTFVVFNKPAWSLSTELFFAFVFPFLVPLLARPGLRSKIALLLAATVAPILAATLAEAVGRGGMYLLYFNPVARLPEFLAGMLIYDLWRHYRWRMDGAAWEIAALGLFFASLFLTMEFPLPYRYCAVFVPAGVLLIMVLLDGAGPVRRFLASDALRYLGQLAFGFYIIHFVVIGYVGETALARTSPADPLRWMLLPGLIAASLAAAAVVHHGVELTTQKRLRQWLERAIGLVRPARNAAS